MRYLTVGSSNTLTLDTELDGDDEIAIEAESSEDIFNVYIDREDAVNIIDNLKVVFDL